MFENKTLVGIGCSHVYGSYEGDYNIASCHERSWVNKLEKLGNFKSSINLGLEGGSNDRSVRELINFLKNNSADSLVVIFSITELSRTEFPISNNNQKCVSHWTLKDEAFIADIKKKEFLENEKLFLNEEPYYEEYELTYLKIDSIVGIADDYNLAKKFKVKFGSDSCKLGSTIYTNIPKLRYLRVLEPSAVVLARMRAVEFEKQDMLALEGVK
mgnify:CR=1 FL=1